MVHSDHLALRQINQPINSNRIHTCWFAFLQRFNFSIQQEVRSFKASVTVIEAIKDLYEADPDFGRIWADVKNKLPRACFTI